MGPAVEPATGKLRTVETTRNRSLDRIVVVIDPQCAPDFDAGAIEPLVREAAWEGSTTLREGEARP